MVATMPTSPSSRRAGHWARLDQPLNPIPLAAGAGPGGRVFTPGHSESCPPSHEAELTWERQSQETHGGPAHSSPRPFGYWVTAERPPPAHPPPCFKQVK